MHAYDSLTVHDFDVIRSYLHDVAGITLSDRKRQMVENRINKRLAELNIQDFKSYVKRLKSKTHQDELVHLVNSLTTNVTHFFRENHHFDHVKSQMHQLCNDYPRGIKIWSAACSIGAEPYSIAMSVNQALKGVVNKPSVKILATDIDTLALARARQGVFHSGVIKGLSKSDLLSYFTADKSDKEIVYKIHPDMRKMVSFNYLNFNDRTWPMSGPFHMIFCRNALIYFDKDKQREFVYKMKNLLMPGGFLYLGHSEHSATEELGFQICGQTIYQKPMT